MSSTKRACASPAAAVSKSPKLAEGLKTTPPAGEPHVAFEMQPTTSRRLVVLDTSAGEIACATMSSDGGQNPLLDEMRELVADALAARLRASSASAAKQWAGRTGERTVAYGEPHCPASIIPSAVPAAPPNAGNAFALTEAQATIVRTIADGGPRCIGTLARRGRGGRRAGDLVDSFESAPHVGARPCVSYLCAQTGAGTRAMATVGALQFLVNHRATLRDQLASWSAHDGEPSSVHARVCVRPR